MKKMIKTIRGIFNLTIALLILVAFVIWFCQGKLGALLLMPFAYVICKEIYHAIRG
jgi:ABC-type polysaccharide/polyol phosphate export permease